MNGSLLRRRLRRFDGDPKPPAEVATSDTEYFSDSVCHAVEQPRSTSIHGYSPSRYASGIDCAEESDDDDPVAAFESQAEASGSALPSPTVQSSPIAPVEEDLLGSVNDRAWYEFDLSVVLALLSPIANWLTGSDHVKNILLILLLIFYLHQIIEVPWSLYQSSRPRRTLRTVPKDDASTADKYHRAALTELHTLEIFYLILSVLSPFLGAALLRSVVVSLSGPSTISWFSISLFVLATGMRPWKHAIQRIRQRITDLHTAIHYPPSDTQKMEALMEKVAQLEAELKSLREQSKDLNSEMYEHVEDAIEVMETVARRQEKKTEIAKTSLEARLTKLEQNVEHLLERIEIRADGPAVYGVMGQVSAFISSLIDQLSPILARSRNNIHPSARSSPKMGRFRPSMKLETIPEVATFQPKSSSRSSPSLRIPGLGLALRIGDLATLPLRRIVAYLLAGQIYTPRTHA